MTEPDDPSLREKLTALLEVARFRPAHAATVLCLKLVVAIFEGIGLTFLLPIVEFAQTDGDLGDGTSQIVGYFVAAYDVVGVPVTLETLLLGLAAVMTLRFGGSFLIGWLQASLTTSYMAHLRRRTYENLLAAEVSYVDDQDGDEIVNTVITESQSAARVVADVLSVVEKLLFAIVYGTVALVLSPVLTVVSVVVLGTIVFLTRFTLDPGYDIGDTVARANEEVQSLINAGTRGLREIKLFNVDDDLTRRFGRAHDDLVDTRVRLERNQVALSNFNQLLNAFVIFALVYLAIEHLALGFSTLAAFLFAMFRLSPLISGLNNTLYAIDGSLPHLVRAQSLIEDLEANAETSGTTPAPSPVTELEFENVSFRYDDAEDPEGADDTDVTDVTGVSLRVERGETVALVGPSGAGKSTVVSLLSRLYVPDEGRIAVDGVDLASIDVDDWHDRVTVVPQRPFLFTGTLRYNVTIGTPEADEEAIERACELSQVSSFLEELPDGLDTELGDDGIRLSGGQRQRIAIARALLSDADVLILDEATSELDAPTEAAILEGIAEMDRTYATVVIGHVLTAIKDADRIYTVVDGEIVESGTHRELLEGDTQYAALYESQIAVSGPS